MIRNCWFSFFLIFPLVAICGCSRLEDDLTITQDQKQILDKFRKELLPHLIHEYMKDDIYLIRWLRAKDFNVDAAKAMLLKSLEWRKTNRIDNIAEEDWSYFEEGFPYVVDGVNKQGQPMLIIGLEKWNNREAILTGRREMLVKWMVKMLEDATVKVRVLQSQGKNVTRWSMVNTLATFNLVESGCIQCLGVYASFVINYEANYPNMMDQLIIVDTPGVFEAALQVVRPLMTPETKRNLRVMGTDRRKWQAELLQEIDRDQLPRAFGGTKTYANLDY